MEGLTMMRFFAGVVLIFLIATPIKAKPTTTPAPPSEEKDILLMVPTNEDNLEVVPIDDGPKNDDGEILETANSIVFRPLFSYRRTHSQRRRVYAPRRIGYHYGSYYDRFPTLA